MGTDMLRWCVLVAWAAVCAGAVVELGEGDVEKLFEITRSEDEANLVLLYDGTTGGGVYAREMLAQTEQQLRLYADSYAVDISSHKLKWIAQAFGMTEDPGYAFLFYSPSLSKPAAKPGVFQRPGGVKKPATYAGPLTNLKAWLQAKQPEPKGLKMMTPKKEEEVLKEVGKVEGNVLVVYTDKEKVTAALKAVCVRAAGVVKKAIVATVKKPSLFGVEKLPALVLYTEAGEKKVFGGKMEREDLEEFFGKEAKDVRMKALLEADEKAWGMALKKFKNPVVHISTAQEWEDIVLGETLGLVLVAFLDTAEDGHLPMLKVLTEISRKHATLRAVTYVPTANSAALMEHFAVEPNSIIFISPKAGKYMKFTGSQSVKGITRFIEGPLTKPSSARDIGTPPPFTE